MAVAARLVLGATMSLRLFVLTHLSCTQDNIQQQQPYILLEHGNQHDAGFHIQPTIPLGHTVCISETICSANPYVTTNAPRDRSQGADTLHLERVRAMLTHCAEPSAP